ncbi:MAG: hypothetical protein ACTSO9_17790, partial [Candidatus Helarchaeota archaeon]
MTVSIKLKKINSPKRKIIFGVISFLLVFNFFIPLILNYGLESNSGLNNLLNLDLFDFNKNKNPVVPPGDFLSTLGTADLEGNGNNR